MPVEAASRMREFLGGARGDARVRCPARSSGMTAKVTAAPAARRATTWLDVNRPPTPPIPDRGHDEGETSRDPRRRIPPRRAFEVIAEAGGKTERLRLTPAAPGPFLVGHSVVCDVRLPDRSVSRRHASLELVEGGLRLVDLGSTNGTFLGTTRVVEVLLQGGEQVRLGSAVLRVEANASTDVAPPEPRTRFGRVRGASAAMQRLYTLFDRLAASKVSVILEGETGTGKEVLAESLHEASPVAKGPYVVFDCTAVPPSLVESELFGHEKGAFTGAVGRRRGVFELAHGGTLLIDEIGDLEPSLQPKLLRVLERGEVRRVGGDQPIAVDVRVLAATRRNLDKEVQEGRFRDDLFHRLAVARVELPPLRKRREDIPMLTRVFWEQLGGVPEEYPADEMEALKHRDWPGNIRELRNAVARRIALGRFSAAHVEDEGGAEEGTASQGEGSLDAALDLELPLPELRRLVSDRLERKYVRKMLDKHGGNVTRAAEASGIALRYFHRIKARAT